ncbi:DNA polymerase [Neobacillus vireti]|uniref:DNA polymerase n=1 Tax=Neobacillus vireti TaxID=220686 RepID=UPI002FFEA88E
MSEFELTFDLSDELEEEKVKETKKKARSQKAKVKKEASKFEPTWEQVWNGYENPKTGKWKNGIWQMKDSKTVHRQWLQEVKDAIESGELGLEDPVTKEPISVGKFSKSKAKELYAVLEQRKREQRLRELVEHCPDNYYLITEKDQMENLVKYLEEETETGLDTETTGLDVYVDVMVGISITLPKKDFHVYIPFGHTTGEKQLPRNYVLKMLRPYLMSKTKKFLHNAKFDKHMFIRHKSNIGGIIHDTQIAMQLLNENEPSKRLKDLLTKYKNHLGFKEDSYTFEQLFGKNAPFHEVPLEVAKVYACKDTHGCYLLGKWQEQFFQKMFGLKRVFYEIESPLLPVVVDMEQTGMLCDMEFGKEYGHELTAYLEELEKEIKEELGDINLNSPAQLQKVLYDDFELEDVSGKRSTDKKTLEILADELPVLNTLLKYKDLFKLNSTYISALPEKVKSDGRIHGQFNQDKTDTGRFSSSEPNLQNLPARARKLVIAPEGKVIFGIDFSQIEPRVLSHITGDEELRRPYLTGGDLYATLASRTFKRPIEECGDGSKYRKMMKTGLLAVMYGTSMWTLSKQLKITVGEAEQFIHDFYEAYPKVKAWIESIWEFVKEHQYVETLYGRKRRFPKHRQQAEIYDDCKAKMLKILGSKTLPQDFWNKKKYPQLPYKLKKKFQSVKKSVERVRRQAVNAIIQGSSADIMKIAMLRMDTFLKQKGWRLMATVHDELLMITDDTITHDEIIQMNDCMRLCVELEVPLKTDVEVMATWGNGIKFDVNQKVFFHKDEKTGKTMFESAELKEAVKYIEEVA